MSPTSARLAQKRRPSRAALLPGGIFLPRRSPSSVGGRHWTDLIRFLDDVPLAPDTHPVKTQIHPIALARQNARVAGNQIGAENRVMLVSLVATGKLSGVNPVDYSADTLRALLDGYPRSREDLLPWRHTPPSSLAA